MSKFVVVTDITGPLYYLRGTVWTSELIRATQHDTREQAQDALDNARRFMKGKTYKAARIIELGAA